MVYINTGTEAVPVWTAVAHATEHSISHKADMRERSTKQTGRWKRRRSGELSETITINALNSYDGYGYFDLLALQTAGTSILVKYSGRPAADVTAGVAENAEATGDKYREGKFVIETIDRNDPNADDSSLNVVLNSDGIILTKTVGTT